MDRDERILHKGARWAWHFDDVACIGDLARSRFDGGARLDVGHEHAGVQALQHAGRRIIDGNPPVILLARRKPFRAIIAGKIAIRLRLILIDRAMAGIAIDQLQVGRLGFSTAHLPKVVARQRGLRQLKG